MLFSVKIVPFIIGALVNMLLGALWYSPVLFAKVWMKEVGITQDYIEVSKGKMGKVYMYTTVMAFISSYVLGFLIVNLGIVTISNALLVAGLLWLGLDLPMIVKNWGFEERSVKLGLINHGYALVVYIIVSVLYVIF